MRVPAEHAPPDRVSLRARLSRAHVTVPIVFAILLLFQAASFRQQIDELAGDAVGKLMRVCHSAEAASTAALSLPRTAAVAVNRGTTEMVKLALVGFKKAVAATLKIFEQLVVFMVLHYVSFIRCTLDTLVKGTVETLQEFVREIEKFFGQHVKGAIETLNKELDGLDEKFKELGEKIKDGAVNTARKVKDFDDDTARKAKDFFDDAGRKMKESADDTGAKIKSFFEGIPRAFGKRSGVGVVALAKRELRMPNVAEQFKDFKFDQGDVWGSIKNFKLPSFKDIEDKIRGLITAVFSDVRDMIMRELDKVEVPTIEMVAAPPETSVAFCADKLDAAGIAAELRGVMHTGTDVAFGVLAAAILALLALSVARIWYTHRLEARARAQLVAELAANGCNIHKTAHDVELQLTAPLYAKFKRRVASSSFSNSPAYNSVLWLARYLTDRHVLLCLSMGALGLLSIYAQLAFLGVARDKLAPAAARQFDLVQADVVRATIEPVNNLSRAFTQDLNAAIAKHEQFANEKFFGWVDVAVNKVNGTISEGVGAITTVINTVMDPIPPLRRTVGEFVLCQIESKLAIVRTVLRFMKEDLEITLPRVDEKRLKVDQDDIRSLTERVDRAFLDDEDRARVENGDASRVEIVVGRIVDKYEARLRAQMWTYEVVLGYSASVVVFGLMRVVWVAVMERRRAGKRRMSAVVVVSDAVGDDLSANKAKKRHGLFFQRKPGKKDEPGED